MTSRVAAVTDTTIHLGPDLARELARRGHNLVIGEPADGLADEILDLGVEVEVVTGVSDLSVPGSAQRLVDAALSRFGQLDAACFRPGRIEVGPALDASVETLRSQVQHNLESVLHILQAVVPPMLAAGSGQVLVITSAAGARPVLAAPIYSATRAAANMLIRSTALSIASSGVTLNAAGTNFLDYPAFRDATGADDPDTRAAIEARIPLKRLGSTTEVAHFCAGLLDGMSRFQTGQFFSISGGWSA